MFENATIEKQAKLIGSSMNRGIERIVRTEKREFYPASSAQERLFYEQMANKSSLNSNNSSVYKISGNLDVDRLQYGFKLLMKRHEGLRTRFALHDQDIVQQIDEEAVIELQFFDQNDYKTIEEAFHDFVTPLDLLTGPLMRCGLYKQEETVYFLMIDIHHIVCDGISVNILMNDFKNIYQGNVLAPTDIKYIDYAHWQNAQKKGLQKEREYWRHQLSGGWQRINMPVIQNREETEIYLAERSILIIDGDQYQAIKKAASEWGVSNFMLLLSVYYLLLSKISGNTDIIIGTDALGRSKPSLMNVVGTFVNVLPLRIQISEQQSFETFLQGVKQNVLEAFDNQEYQFDQMSTLLRPGEQKQIVDIYFSSTDFWKKETEINDLEFTALKIGKPVCTTRYELELNIDDTDGKLYLTFIYSTSLYDSQTIGLFMQYYHNILTAILKDESVEIGCIELENSLQSVVL
jgi:iturin family lipopeptide synthetase A